MPWQLTVKAILVFLPIKDLSTIIGGSCEVTGEVCRKRGDIHCTGGGLIYQRFRNKTWKTTSVGLSSEKKGWCPAQGHSALVVTLPWQVRAALHNGGSVAYSAAAAHSSNGGGSSFAIVTPPAWARVVMLTEAFFPQPNHLYAGAVGRHTDSTQECGLFTYPWGLYLCQSKF